MAEEAGLQVDLQAYESEMEAARERSRSGGGAGDDADLPPERLAALAERVAATDDSARDSHEGCSATVGALLVSGNLVEEAQSVMRCRSFSIRPIFMPRWVAKWGHRHPRGRWDLCSNSRHETLR